jgi:hypothetical protein
MDVAVGIDVAKESHWAVATRLDPQTGKSVNVLSLRVDNTPAAISALIDQVTGLVRDRESLQVGIDMLGVSPACWKSCSRPLILTWSMCLGWP